MSLSFDSLSTADQIFVTFFSSCVLPLHNVALRFSDGRVCVCAPQRLMATGFTNPAAPAGEEPATKKKGKKLTPDYYHVLDDATLRANVYEPEADSFLLLDALDAAREVIRAARPVLCAEIGVGSGVALTHLAMILATNDDDDDDVAAPAPSTATFVAIDVNPLALAATDETFRRSFAGALGPPRPPPPLLRVRGDLLSWLRRSAVPSSPFGHIDVLLFNPPYVPTSDDELRVATRGGANGHDWLPSAWSGGTDGRVVLDRCLPMLPLAMARGGHVFLVAMEENDPPGIVRHVRALCHATGRTVAGGVVLSRWTGERLRILHLRFDAEEEPEPA